VYNGQLNGRQHVTRMGPGALSPNEAFGGGIADDPQVFYPRDPIRVLRQRLWTIVIVTVMIMGLAAGFTSMQTPTYGASIMILVGQKQGSDTDNLLTEVQGLQGITETVATAITTRPVAQAVVEELDLSMYPEEIQANLDAQVVGETQFIEVSYADTDPERAQLVVNTLGEVLSQQVAEVSSDTSDITATVWEKAVSSYLVGPSLMRNVLLALVLGMMLGVGLAFLRDYLDDDWKSPEEVERVSGVATLGVIPAFKLEAPKSKRGD
jgi:capsular polysaccharide biosynthesis protein